MVIAYDASPHVETTTLRTRRGPTGEVPVSDDLAMASAAEHEVTAPFAGVVVAIAHARDEHVGAGSALVVLEAMKMEHEVLAETDGVIRSVAVAVGDAVQEGQLLLMLASSSEGEPGEAGAASTVRAREQAASGERADLRAVRERHEIGLDAARPEAVAQRRERGRRTARENLADLLDADTFVEYGPLLFAAQERRRSREELIARTPADGLVGGLGRVAGRQCVAMSYDYTVLAGTQGMRNHAKKDRLFELAERRRLPVVLFAEGGGGRPGDVDMPIVAGLDCRAFELFAQLSGLVPLVGIASGYCFAGNAALLGCCDVVIATEDSSIGMGGPAMIEGGGLGVFAPGDVGPIEVQYANGVVDLRAGDDAEAVALAKRYLSYFAGASGPGGASGGAGGASQRGSMPDQERLRELIPEQRKRVYDVRRVVETLFDEGSVLELRRGFAAGMLTALARVDGRPLGVLANDPTHLGGAIDADGADKAARFMQLCDAYELPLLFLCDTPGFMVGPAAEQTATVRHFARMFLGGANVTVPTGTIVLRKGYGLGAQAMAGGGFKAPLFTVAWPTSEFGGMGLEGAVRLGMRRELDAIEDEQERERLFEQLVAAAYERGEGVNMAAYGEIDDVIDPADSRRWIATLFDEHSGEWWRRAGKKRPHVDAW
jgi:acetyl-CoA carboxylase carboxyltransferase component/biotin carboxyl carrier protein